MELLNPSGEVVARVREVVAEAARPLLAEGRSRLATVRLTDLAQPRDFDCPVVVLTPTNPEAARVAVHVHEDDSWWMFVADGPGTELRDDMEEDRYELLERLVRAVIQGRYRHGPCSRQVKRLLRPPRQLAGWYETFETERGPVSSEHFGREAPTEDRRYPPY